MSFSDVSSGIGSQSSSSTSIDETGFVTADSLHQSEISFQAEHFNFQTTLEPNLSTTSSVHSLPQFAIAEPMNNSEFNFVDPIIPPNTDDHSSNNSREFSLDLEQSAVQTTDEQLRLLVTCLSNLSNLLVTRSNLESSELHFIQNELQNCLYLVSNQLSASNESENRFADSTYTQQTTNREAFFRGIDVHDSSGKQRSGLSKGFQSHNLQCLFSQETRSIYVLSLALQRLYTRKVG